MDKSDDNLLARFLYLKGQTSQKRSTLSFIQIGHDLNELRSIIVQTDRSSIIPQIIESDWNDLDSNEEPQVIKDFIKGYMDRVISPGSFISVYNGLQLVIKNPADISYYLNPLKFKGNERAALATMKIDPTLDYSGLISACRVHKIEEQLIQTFIAKLHP